LCPADPSVKAKSQVSLYVSWGHVILNMQYSTTGQAKQKISANLDYHWSKKKCSFLCVQTNWFCPSRTQRFYENDSDSCLESLIVTRDESFCEKMTWVESPFFSTWLISSHLLESHYHWEFLYCSLLWISDI